MFKRVGLYAKKGDPKVGEMLSALLRCLLGHGIEPILDPHCAELLGAAVVKLETGTLDGRNCDLVIAVGGDGTLLNAARNLFDYKVRLLGVNLGHLGFLADLTPDQVPQGLEAILAGQFIEEPRSFLHCAVWRGDTCVAQSNALNDVSVQKWNTARLIALSTYIDGVFLHNQRSDGLIVSTPTGSTAYSMSGGGPILHPALNAVVVLPICPHTLTHRPIVVSAKSEIEIQINTREPDLAHLSCDGEDICMLAPGDRVRIRTPKDSIRLIHPADHDHYATLRAKLHWGTDPC
jgi:NAD+ kinase